MSQQVFQFVEIVNRLKHGTVEGRVLWERTGSYGHQYVTSLDNGHKATVACAPNGSSVLFIMTNGLGVETLHLDSSRTSQDLLRLALLQLFVTVRDTLTHHMAREALEAVKDL